MSDAPTNDDAGLLPHEQPGAAPGQNSAGRMLNRYQAEEPDAHGNATVRDRMLDRAAQARIVAPAAADALEQEARFMARLDHVGAPVVLDFVRGDGGAMLVTRRVAGITLAEAVQQARGAAMPPELASPAAAVQTMLKVCDAVAAVHAQGVVHHALRPECILLATHGQVVVQDWSAAMEAQSSPATLRYVSTIRASESIALDGLHRDIQAIGACLCAAVLLRAPRPDGSDALGPIAPGERVRMPSQLESIIRQALSSDPGGGYRSVMQLAQDLQRFCDGVAPEAHQPGSAARIADWMHRCRRPLLIATASVLAVVAILAGLLGGRLRDWVSWREVVHEDFSDPAWSQRWVEPPTVRGMFAVRDGRLVSTSDSDALLIFRQRLSAPVAIEYTGEILPGAQPCDLSVQWSEASGVADEPGRFARDGRSFMIQAGAFTNQFCAIYENPGRRLLAHANRQLEIGRRYRFRVEIDGVRLRMSIDGETVLEHVGDHPSRSGYLALYGYYPGKAFDDVRILQRHPSPLAGPLAVADQAAIEGRHAAAADLYAAVVETDADPQVRQRAAWLKGLAEWRSGQSERAARTWRAVTDPELSLRIACTRLEGSFAVGQSTPHLTGFEELWNGRPEARGMLRQTWQNVLQRQVQMTRRDPLVVDYFLAVRERLFPADASARWLAADALQQMGRNQEVIDRFPAERTICIRAMLALGRSAEALALPDIGRDERRHAHGMRGEFEQVLALQGLGPPWRAWTLIRMGRAEQALREEVDAAYPALLHLGRAAELVEQTALSGQAANDTLICLGRLPEAAGDGDPALPGSGSSVTAMLLLGQVDLAERVGRQPRTAIRCMQALERGDAAEFARLRRQLVPPPHLGGSSQWFAPYVLAPVLDHLAGDASAPESLMRPQLAVLSGVFQRSPWFICSGVLGDIPLDEVGQMPCVSEAQAWTVVAAGMRAEVQGDRPAAVAAYRAFVDLPVHRRLLAMNAPDPDVEWFVTWRLRALR